MDKKNLKIDSNVHNKLKEYCDNNFLKMSEWASNIILNHILELEKNDGKN